MKMLATQLTTITTATATVAVSITDAGLTTNPTMCSDVNYLLPNSINGTSIKIERRGSSTSESSLEHLDLDRTPKKLKQATSTPMTTKYGDKFKRESTKRFRQLQFLKDSDEANCCDNDKSTYDNTLKINYTMQHEQPQQHHQHQRSYQYHNRYPYCKRYLVGGRHQSEKRTRIQLPYNTDNRSSLRKRFCFNRSSADLTMVSNESGFADSTGGNNNNYSVNNNPTNHNANKSNTSSAASTPPHSGQNDISSPESGIGEREDMKYVCPICEVVSATPHEFTNHIRCHNYASGDTENFTCRICSKVLSSASSLDRHVLVHTGERPFNCKYCHLTFTTNGNMHRHMRTHKQHQHTHHRRSSNKQINNFNHSNTAQNSTANTNVNITAIVKTAVSNSSKDQSSATANFSMRCNNNNNTSSNNSNSNLSSHHLLTTMITTISSATGENNGEFGGCIESYESDGSSSSEFSIANSHNNDNHINLNNDNYKRKLEEQGIDFQMPDKGAKKEVNSYNNGSNTIYVQATDNVIVCNKESNSELACPVCNEGDFSNMQALDNHMDAKHPEIPAKCKHCQVIFRTHYQLNVHSCEYLNDTALHTCMLKSNDIEERSEATAEAGINENATCPSSNDCNENNDNQKNYENNQAMLHQFDLKNSMSNGMVIENHQSLVSAQKTEHSEDDIKSETSPPDVKDLTDIQSIFIMTSSSNTSNFLKNFEQFVNTPSSQHSYDRDDEEVQDVFTAEFRKMKLRGEFPCKLCTVIFPNLRALKGHNRIHLSKVGPAGPFRCNMCPYQICDKTALVRHMRNHNGDRPYECAVCNYAFTTKANCERHLRNRHAKITREEVKRSIIYHPSEDSTCEDPSKKIQLFSSTEFEEDKDMMLYHQQNHSKDNSIPVSHLKETLISGDGSPVKPVKIQVKSLEKLLDKASDSPVTLYSNNYDICQEKTLETSQLGPIDMSLDAHVLDLSKKSTPEENISSTTELGVNVNKIPESKATDIDEIKLEQTVGNSGHHHHHAQKHQQQRQQQQQLFLASQQLLNDPAQYLQQLYRNIIFPQLNPFCLSNSFLANNSMNDIHKYAPFLSRMFGIGDLTIPHLFPLTNESDTNNAINPTSNNITTLLPQISPLATSDKSSSTSLNSFTASSNEILHTKTKLPLSIQKYSVHPNAKNRLPNSLISNGSVKMVLKNGVFMPKQKQRRYRTERPFACEHCSARFTLRSNMERHVKQQHPQFYAQRQRSCIQIMRGRNASNTNNINGLNQMPSPLAHLQNGANSAMDTSSSISDQVKYAILAQQLISHKDTDLLQKRLPHGSGNIFSNNDITHPAFNFSHMNNTLINGVMEEDEPKLVIDEDDEDYEDERLYEENDKHIFIDERDNFSMEKEKEIQDTTKNGLKLNSEEKDSMKKDSESILEQAIKSGTKTTTQFKSQSKIVTAGNTMKSLIAQAPAVGKFLKEVARSPFKDESQDLVPVSKLVDNATCNSVSFNNYFRSGDINNHMEQSDEEGLVASGSTSESNNSGAEDTVTNVQPKKKSAYSLAPNRVSCPYCQRMFPWSSSLRRHILTHTGQKPFKCSHCPLLFTTKSNCDRHLLRKHGNIESATSVYVPTEDVSEPIPPPKSVEEIVKLQRQREEEDRKRQAEEACEKERLRLEKQMEKEKDEEEQQRQTFLKELSAQQFQQFNSSKTDLSQISSSELPFKCHLCENSFSERGQCLDHIKCLHSMEFSLLFAKGAIASDTEAAQIALADDEERIRFNELSYLPKTGKYPDYNNRKVVCAFCIRRFWSTEDLRRHMRTHSGERPFQCEICLRKFTLKHSMLRHMKKHNGFGQNGDHSACDSILNGGNSGSDYSDDEQSNNTSTVPPAHAQQIKGNMNILETKIRGLLKKINDWHGNSATTSNDDHNQNVYDMNTNDNNNNNNHNDQPSDLIGNLLGIRDQTILSKLMSSPDEAAKLLGVNE